MKIGLLALLPALLFLNAAFADTGWRQEIDHLLIFIEQSNCTFTRNGKAYDSVQAREHIGKKYDYLKKRITSAEQFITYTATKSSITGEKYTVTCAGDTQPSKQWLETELNRFRNNSETAGQLTD